MGARPSARGPARETERAFELRHYSLLMLNAPSLGLFAEGFGGAQARGVQRGPHGGGQANQDREYADHRKLAIPNLNRQMRNEVHFGIERQRVHEQTLAHE